ncbi:MAG: Sapep family Mn(2+)-dependent dipeptidase [Saccharofermentanales bacterium]
MLTENLNRFAVENGWYRNEKEGSVYGVHCGYPFTITDGRNFKAFITPVAGIDANTLAALHNYFAEHKKELKLINYSISDNFLVFRVKEPVFALPIESIQHILDTVTLFMEEQKVPVNACVVCGLPAEKRGLYYGLYACLHRHCVNLEPVDFTPIRNDDQADSEKDDPAAAAAAEISAADSALIAENIKYHSMEEYMPAMTEALTELCSIPSVKGEPTAEAPYGAETLRALQAFLALGESLGLKAVNLDGRAGYVEAGSGERLIAALCHLDVVPAGEGWTANPFEPQVLADRVVARGAIDDKGPAVAALYALKALLDEGKELAARVRIIVGLDEENGSTCMEHYVKTSELPTAGFTPDADFPVIYAEKGIAWYRLSASRKADTANEDANDTYYKAANDSADQTANQAVDQTANQAAAVRLVAAKAGNVANMVPDTCTLTLLDAAGQTITEQYHGRSAHGSRPEAGENAIAKAFAALAPRLEATGTGDAFVTAFNKLIAATTDGSLAGLAGQDESGKLTLNAGVLALDETKAELDIDIRYPVTWQLIDVEQRLRDAAAAVGLEVGLIREQAPLYSPRDLPLVRTLMQVYSAITGDTEAQPLAIGGGTYARSMPNIVAFGPGFPAEPDNAHQPDESISLAAFEKAARIYREAFRALVF